MNDDNPKFKEMAPYALDGLQTSIRSLGGDIILQGQILRQFTVSLAIPKQQINFKDFDEIVNHLKESAEDLERMLNDYKTICCQYVTERDEDKS